MSKSLVVFIKFYNGTNKQLRRIFKNLDRQVLKPNKVVIVDNGSPTVNPDDIWINDIRREFRTKLNVQYCRWPDKKSEPDLDTVGLAMNCAFIHVMYRQQMRYDYVSWIDLDTLLSPDYFHQIVGHMESDPELMCASGELVVADKIEDINVGAKLGRKDARGSGKVVRGSFLTNIPQKYFPEVDWDTWLNTKAKIKGFKAKQISGVYLFTDQPTTRVKNLNPYRNGRLSYHFGYNLLLVLMKTILSKGKALEFLRGYREARRTGWILPDKEVRRFFGWRFLFHPFR